MSEVVTVIGGVSGSSVTGLVNVTLNVSSSLQSALQTLLTNASETESVSGFQNLYAIGATNAAFTGSPVLAVLSNTSTNGAVGSGSYTGALALPTSVTTFVDQVPGSQTITSSSAATGQLFVFGAASNVTFAPTAGSGSVVAGGNHDFVGLGGNSWTVTGSSAGGDTINSTATNAVIAVSGSGSATGNATSTSVASNVVGLAGNATVISSGTDDLIAPYAGNAVVSVTGSANVIGAGGNVTVDATATSTLVKAFFTGGGSIYFINHSNNAAYLAGDAISTATGSATVFGGVGGGAYEGGTGVFNALYGQSGNVTLQGAGQNNLLSVNGASNYLYASSFGTDSLIASSASGANNFVGGGGTEYLTSSGTGLQSFFLGDSGSESITGSTVTGAANNYYILQNSVQGGGTDVITDFRVGTDHIYINPTGFGTATGVTISSATSLPGGTSGTLIQLSNGTDIKLYGVSATSLASVVGGTTI